MNTLNRASITEEELVAGVAKLVDGNISRDELLKRAVQILKEGRSGYDWVGIYLLSGDTLVLHNYIGKPTEHTQIPVGVGVCGTAVAELSNQVINDVRKLENYLACSQETRSEIVVLIRRGAEIFGQIDIDSDKANAFGVDDESMLQRIADLLATRF
jgi:GAF domain-containing protein